MTKINQTYNYSRPSSIAARPDTVEISTDRMVKQATTPPTIDKITLSNAGLEAAARFSNFVQRSTDTYTLALPAPQKGTSSSDLLPTEPPHETPVSRKLVRTTYAEQQNPGGANQPFPGSQIDILA